MSGVSQELPYETRLLLAVDGVLALKGAKQDEHRMRLQTLVREGLPGHASPECRLLVGASDAYLAVLAVPNHPLRLEIVRMLKASSELMHRMPPSSRWQPTYTGGALRHFEREADR